MYQLYADEVCIYDDAFALENMKVMEPKLSLADNSAGSLSLKLPPSNKGYDTVTRLKTTIRVYRDEKPVEYLLDSSGSVILDSNRDSIIADAAFITSPILWEGRVLDEKLDFWNNRTLFCEGALAYFNDTTQPRWIDTGPTSVRNFVARLLAEHNAKVPANRRFLLGDVNVSDSGNVIRYTNYEKTLECLNSLVEELGGHLRVRFVGSTKYLDYLASYDEEIAQQVTFGRNLLDFTRNWSMSEYATVILPLGAQIQNETDYSAESSEDTTEENEPPKYVTVESVNGGSPYVASTAAVNNYGWIVKKVEWNEVEDPAELLRKAQSYLSGLQFDKMTIELSAIDLSYQKIGMFHRFRDFSRIKRKLGSPRFVINFSIISKI